MSYKIKNTDSFNKDLKRLSKKYVSIKTDYAALLQSLLITPTQGIPIGKDCYKIRIAIFSKNKGKSGGGRVITLVRVIKEEVFLLAIYDKSEKEDISNAELKQLLEDAGLI